jgi:hypothetical protein
MPRSIISARPAVGAIATLHHVFLPFVSNSKYYGYVVGSLRSSDLLGLLLELLDLVLGRLAALVAVRLDLSQCVSI